MTTHRLFVLGTLKRGQPNHQQFAASNGVATFVGQARTVAKWPLVIASDCNIPYLLHKEGMGMHIVGEIYDVDDKMLKHCDVFEGCPDYYQRVPIRVRHTTDSADLPLESSEQEEEEVSVYLLRNYRDELLELPYHENYDSYGSHGLKFMHRYEQNRENSDHKAQVMIL